MYDIQDAAETYPVPPRPETQGRTEIALGKWLKTRTRHNVVVATKVIPPPHVQNAWCRVSGRSVCFLPLLVMLVLVLPLPLLLLLLPPLLLLLDVFMAGLALCR